MALIYTDEYYREQNRIRNERRFNNYFKLIFIQLIFLFSVMNLHEINNSFHLIPENRVESNFNSYDTKIISAPITFDNSSVGYVKYDIINNYSDDHRQTGRTIIDVTIAQLNNHDIRYRCSFYNFILQKNEVSNQEEYYYLNC